MPDTPLAVAVICAVALVASGLTFFSGFGLGTLLLPAFALYFPVERAVALTAVVHFLNGLFKLLLVGRAANRDVLVRFGGPAVLASAAGAAVLVWLTGLGATVRYELFDRELAVTPVKVVVGLLLLAFAVIDLVPRLRDLTFPRRHLPYGGLLSGFFGGLSGMQGALRSAFLSRVGLSKESFVGTGVAIAVLIDVARLAIYSGAIFGVASMSDLPLLAAAVLAAFVGSVLGNRYLKKLTRRGVQRFVAVTLFAVAIALIAGVL